MACWFPGTAMLPVGTDADIDANVGTRINLALGLGLAQRLAAGAPHLTSICWPKG